MGAHILRIRDSEGKPLPDARILPHLGMLFFAGTLPPVLAHCAIVLHPCQ